MRVKVSESLGAGDLWLGVLRTGGKTMLFGIAPVLAAIGRWSSIGARRLHQLRSQHSTAEGAVVAAVLVVAGVLANVSPPAPASASCQ